MGLLRFIFLFSRFLVWLMSLWVLKCLIMLVILVLSVMICLWWVSVILMVGRRLFGVNGFMM